MKEKAKQGGFKSFSPLASFGTSGRSQTTMVIFWPFLTTYLPTVDKFLVLRKSINTIDISSKVEQTGFDPITFSFSENSNYWRESLLEVIRQNIAGCRQQTFEHKKEIITE